MNELVQFLCQGKHPIEVALRPEKTTEAFKQCIDRGYVHIRFTDTRGGTELGVRLDPGHPSVNCGAPESIRGTVLLSGSLTLDYVPVRCHAEVDVLTLTGLGRLEVTDGAPASDGL